MLKTNAVNPWENAKTINGLIADEIVSMLQKAIRRGLETEAVDAAYELYLTSRELEHVMWRRLIMIAMEDVGFGDLQSTGIVYTYYQAKDLFERDSGDRQLPFVQAIRYLCRCSKERSSSYYQNLQELKYSRGYEINVPDYALDKHTKRGKEMGRDTMFFYTDGDRVFPEHVDEEHLHTKELKDRIMAEWRAILKAQNGALDE